MDKPINLGFALLELSELFLYETYYDKFQPYFGENIQCHYIDTDASILSIVSKDTIKDLKNFEVFDFSKSNGDHEKFSIKNKKMIGKIKIRNSLEYLY